MNIFWILLLLIWLIFCGFIQDKLDKKEFMEDEHRRFLKKHEWSDF